jgi:hypothetical protein
MKNRTYLFITTIMLVIIAAVSNAKAQTGASPELVANIPFAFSVGEKTLPAGEYTVRCVNRHSSTKVLLISSKDGRNSSLVSTSSVNGSVQDNARLVFRRSGDQYFFAQAWMAADSVGMQAPKSGLAKVRELALEKSNRTVLASTRQ